MIVQDFEALLDCIYAAGEDHRQWNKVLARLTSHLFGCAAALHAGTRDVTGFSFGATYQLDPEALAAYAEYYYSVNPLNSALSRVPVGATVSDHQLVQPRDMERTEFYNDYARRFKIVGSVTIVLARDSLHEACLGVIRGLHSLIPFRDEQVSLVQRLAPHVQRALNLTRRLAALQDDRKTFEAALDRFGTAVLLLTRAGAISYCNAAGLELLEKRDGLKLNQGRLSACCSSTQNLLADLIRMALSEKGARGGSVAVPRQQSALPLIVRIMPFAQKGEFWLTIPDVRAILFISNPDQMGEGADQ